MRPASGRPSRPRSARRCERSSRARALSLTRVARRRLRSFLPRGVRTPRSSDRAGRRARCLCLGRRAVQVPAPAELSRASQTRLSRHGFTSVSAADVRTGLSAEEAYAQLAADAADVELEASDPLARHEITLQARSRTLVLFNPFYSLFRRRFCAVRARYTPDRCCDGVLSLLFC